MEWFSLGITILAVLYARWAYRHTTITHTIGICEGIIKEMVSSTHFLNISFSPNSLHGCFGNEAQTRIWLQYMEYQVEKFQEAYYDLDRKHQHSIDILCRVVIIPFLVKWKESNPELLYRVYNEKGPLCSFIEHHCGCVADRVVY